MGSVENREKVRKVQQTLKIEKEKIEAKAVHEDRQSRIRLLRMQAGVDPDEFEQLDDIDVESKSKDNAASAYLTPTEREIKEREEQMQKYNVGMQKHGVPWYASRNGTSSGPLLDKKLLESQQRREDPLPSRKKATPSNKTTAIEPKSRKQLEEERARREARERERAKKLLQTGKVTAAEPRHTSKFQPY